MRSRSTPGSIFRVTSIATLIAVSGILTACGGGGGDEEPTATTAPSSAQPTVEATAESSPEMIPPTATAPVNTAPPRNTDMSSPRTNAEGESTAPTNVATPAAGTIAQPSGSPASEVVVEGTATLEGTQVPGEPDSGSDTGDGTSGAPPEDEVVQSATPASSTSTPVPSASPEAASTPDAGGPLPVVTSCDVQDVPPFTGDVTVYTLTVDLNFRTGPGADCDMIGDGPLGEFSVVEVVGGPVEREGDESGEWVQVAVGDQVGWLALDFLEPAE